MALLSHHFDGNWPRGLKVTGELLRQVDPKGAQLDRTKETRLWRALNEKFKLPGKNTCTKKFQYDLWKVGKALPKRSQGLMLGCVWQWCRLLTVGWCNICGSMLGIQVQHALHLSFYLIIHVYYFKHPHFSKMICYKMFLLCPLLELGFLSLTPRASNP